MNETRPDELPALLADARRLSLAFVIVHVCAWCDNVTDASGARVGPNTSGAERDTICNECRTIVESAYTQG